MRDFSPNEVGERMTSSPISPPNHGQVSPSIATQPPPHAHLLQPTGATMQDLNAFAAGVSVSVTGDTITLQNAAPPPPPPPPHSGAETEPTYMQYIEIGQIPGSAAAAAAAAAAQAAAAAEAQMVGGARSPQSPDAAGTSAQILSYHAPTPTASYAPSHYEYTQMQGPIYQQQHYYQQHGYFQATGGFPQTVGVSPGSFVGNLERGATAEFGQQVTHSTRASPATVQWLIDHFETAEGVSLPRSQMYTHYLKHCQDQGLDPMNPASFGKLIRSVFLGLRTRRLGTRGHSKYHYYGIRIKPTSPLMQFSEEQFSPDVLARASVGCSTGTKRKFDGHEPVTLGAESPNEFDGRPSQWEPSAVKHSNSMPAVLVSAGGHGPSTSSSAAIHRDGGPTPAGANQSVAVHRQQHRDEHAAAVASLTADSVNPSSSSSSSAAVAVQAVAAGAGGGPPPPAPLPVQEPNPLSNFLSHLGDHSHVMISEKWPKFQAPDPLPDGILTKHIRLFEAGYRTHCSNVLDVICRLEFPPIEQLWQKFWRTSAHAVVDDEGDDVTVLKRTSLYKLTEWEPAQKYISDVDFYFYQQLVRVLIPDVLKNVPTSLTQAIRNFAKNLEGYLNSALGSQNPSGSAVGVPVGVIAVKRQALVAFGQMLRRYTSLNHLAQAARAVLQNHQQITQMLNDLNRIDFTLIQEQASWVCHCDEKFVTEIEREFKQSLQQNSDLEQWSVWLENVVSRHVQAFFNDPTELLRRSKHFLLAWSFYSSLVIRDLTLRSAASFGSFHLIRLLFDEYMFYLVEDKVSKSSGKLALRIMTELQGFGGPFTAQFQRLASGLTNGLGHRSMDQTVATTVAATAVTAPSSSSSSASTSSSLLSSTSVFDSRPMSAGPTMTTVTAVLAQKSKPPPPLPAPPPLSTVTPTGPTPPTSLAQQPVGSGANGMSENVDGLE